MTFELPRSPAVERNRDAILERLSEQFRGRGKVLEIGSGTGEHAVYFAPRLPWLLWQPSDRRENLSGIVGWCEASPAENLLAPIELDVNHPPDSIGAFDAVFSANTAHIMSAAEVAKMFALVGRELPPDGRFCLYGPFNREGRFTSASNERFHASLRAQDPSMGIRDIEMLDRLAETAGLSRSEMHPMPANNFLSLWIKR